MSILVTFHIAVPKYLTKSNLVWGRWLKGFILAHGGEEMVAGVVYSYGVGADQEAERNKCWHQLFFSLFPFTAQTPNSWDAAAYIQSGSPPLQQFIPSRKALIVPLEGTS